ncbi:DNA-binding protein [Companilactobacillus allii]|uniref:Helix-turn-helix domain-containing protein n=1 Tax=Companilactobacillus allii TaxID=1847728 RepID=A0A1P8Q4V1_9LACO|nr:DNA-binding protein [Companilactobacillus allii]APX72887.1 hypothetical protein BTM29_10130 [Companilactobacillus allii]USQ67675.1 DNA-binding protein [Companilactobacillus allii]
MISKEKLIQEEENKQKDLSHKGWLKIANAAIYADCSVATIYSWMKDPIHPLKSVKHNGRRVSVENLDEYLKSFEQNRMF